MNLPLDYILSATTVIVLWLTGNKSIWAPIGGIINNVLWIGYAIYIHQYGLVIGSVCMGAMYVRALVLWRRDMKPKKEMWACPHGHIDERDCPDCCH